jgi:hypothetical protein
LKQLVYLIYYLLNLTIIFFIPEKEITTYFNSNNCSV